MRLSLPLLGLDLGMATLGIAFSRSGHMAQSVENLRFPRGAFEVCYPKVISCARGYLIKGIVLGRPAFSSGDPSPMTAVVEAFSTELQKRLAKEGLSIPIAFQDEGESTLEASSLLREENVSARRQKAKIDQVAACVILERFLRKEGYDVW